MPVLSIPVLVVLALATARITGLITADDITAPIRDRIAYRNGRRSDPRGVLADLATCQWCASVYVAAGVVASSWLWGSHLWLWLIALGLASSQVTGMLSKLGRS